VGGDNCGKYYRQRSCLENKRLVTFEGKNEKRRPEEVPDEVYN